MGKSKELYIQYTTQLWGGQNGEVNLETQDGTILTFAVRELYSDLPSIIAMVHMELEHEEKHQREIWHKLGKKLTKDYK
jgi:hypothetical protein